MSELEKPNVKSIPLLEIVELGRGKVISKGYVNTHPGDYPVYSSQTKDEGIFGYINDYAYDGEYITWTTDGVHAGTTFYRNGKFSCTNVCGVMTRKSEYENISMEYLNTQLNLKEIATGTQNKKVMTHNIEKADIQISVPIDDTGNFDIDEQARITQIYNDLKFRKNQLLEKETYLQNVLITFKDIGIKTKEIDIEELFKLERGKGTYTKKYCNSNQGVYPVYSGNTFGAFSHLSHFDYNGEYLSWAIDGLAGYIMHHHEKFSATNHRGVLVPIAENINLKYLMYTLEPIFRSKAHGRKGVNGENEYTALPPKNIKGIKVPMPINEKGEYDVDVQNQIADKHQQIHDIKSALSDSIKRITSIYPVL